MSVEHTGNEIWTLRTIFSTVEDGTQNVIPLGILRTSFNVDESHVTFLDPIQQVTESWKKTSVGRMTFVHPDGVTLDNERAQMADDFLGRVASLFRVEPPENITMYITRDRDEMCSLFGLEYYAFPPSGLAYPSENVVLTSLADPFYAHELVHVVVHELEEGTLPEVSEGVATWLGGSLNVSLLGLVRGYAERTGLENVPTMRELFEDHRIDQDSKYILSAVLMDAVHKRSGMQGIRSMMDATTPEAAVRTARRILGASATQPEPSMAPLVREILLNN